MVNDVAKILKRLNIAACVIILTLSYIFVFTRLFRQDGLTDIVSFFMNWGIESNKWRYVLSKEYQLSFFKALQATFLGVCVSFIFPNRSGDFLGRGFALPQGFALKGAAATILGNFSQLIVTLIMGVIGGGYMLLAHFYHSVDTLVLCLVFFLVFLLLIFFLYIYFNIGKIYRLCQKIGWLQQSNWMEKLCFFQTYTFKELLNILLFSVGRYVVFVVQMYFAFQVFELSFPICPFVMMTFLYFLFTSLVPTWVLSELGVRASVALLLYADSALLVSASGVTDLSIVAATTFLWLLNVVLPALIGSFFVFSLRVFRTKTTTTND